MQDDPTAALSRPLAFVTAIVPAAAASLIGSAATLPNIPIWYMGLVKPSFTPPNWVFGPVWTMLYILMAIACYRIVRKENAEGFKQPIFAYLAQSVLNGAWSIGFFGLNSPVTGLIIIAPLWASILWTMIIFWRRDLFSGAVFIPYLAWVTFATALNAGIWILNP